MTFNCYYQKEKWPGRIVQFKDYGSYIEIRVESLSSITVIFGKTSLGFFACMPDYEAGCHLIEPENEVYNREKLISVMNPIDGTTVARALYVLFKGLEKKIENEQ
ncbi:hypothetical protein C8C76_1701 [Halanaerobium saccharolyticum]|jgi:hypothetical protein|uniref:Uncharacterized protein n=1 Tax=Halanaerobium saccharolyticum TaxID=43595 RepID=A0A2T5RF01_9FIRM|nr:hypothetical protein [Halanaerobium saccharolyticum]OEG63514.1 MAG: hypothetical protein BHK79_10670 [Halanaerobium sp. MDAL1]PTV92659.1 hypothetical protein C8C76_1701 [Halanaerobium saccharolyticum]TDP79596.1 hypothetical protein C7957_1611 [Halanaerobium saccharolyticum]